MVGIISDNDFSPWITRDRRKHIKLPVAWSLWNTEERELTFGRRGLRCRWRKSCLGLSCRNWLSRRKNWLSRCRRGLLEQLVFQQLNCVILGSILLLSRSKLLLWSSELRGLRSKLCILGSKLLLQSLNYFNTSKQSVQQLPYLCKKRRINLARMK